MAEFDWYQATVREPVEDVIEACMGLGEGCELRHFKGLQGYGHRTVVSDGEGETVGSVWHGGTHAHPHCVFTSEAAIAGSAMLRERWPKHEVSRFDAREDFDGEGAFDRMLKPLLAAAEKHRVRVDTRGDHLLRMEARTVYLGAKQSVVKCRQYDKAAELRAKFSKDPVRLLEVPPHLTRLEVQVNPKGSLVRLGCAQVQPIEVMGATPWMREVMKDVAGLDLSPVNFSRPWRQSDDDRAYSYLLGAFGGVLRRRMEDHGTWAAFGAQLGDDLDSHAKAKRQLRRAA